MPKFSILMNKTSQYQLSVLVPIFNEEENLPRLELKLKEFCETSIVKPVCVMLFNDCSTDSGEKIIKEMCKRNDNFFYFNFKKNSGPSAVYKAGIEICESPYIGYIDADLQTDPQDFNLLLQYREDYALVTGRRARRNDNIIRVLSSRIGNAIRRCFTHDGISDTGCPLKLMQAKYAKKIPLFTGMHRFIPALIQMQGGKVKEVAVSHYPRIAGKAKFGVWNRLFGPLGDCFSVRWMRKRYINYEIESSNLDE